MIQIFTREEGKISAGTHLSERNKGGAALALRPFTQGQYQVSEKRKDLRQISSAETINAHFALGEDADRFAEASYILEFTDKLLPEGVPETGIYKLLTEYLCALERRKDDFRLLTISYMVKVMQELGVFPDAASLEDGELLTEMNGDILDVMKFIEGQPLERMEKLSLDREKENTVFSLIKDFAHKHLDLGMIKSERLFSQGNVDKTEDDGGTNHGNYPRKN
jgi:DNA repair protein RecO (recombination protein O)